MCQNPLVSVVFLLPVYNVAPLLKPVLDALRAASYDVLAIDDGSTVGTSDVLRAAGVQTITHDVNRGKGTALRTGFRTILTRPEVTGVLTIDGDGQHDPVEAIHFLERHAANPDALLLGNRWHSGQAAPALRGSANQFSSWLVRRFSGEVVADSQCGYRLYPTSFLRRVVPTLPEMRFEIETFLLLQAGRLRAPVINIPIRTIYSSETLRLSKYRAVRDSLRIGRTLLAGVFHRLPKTQ